MLRHQLPVYAPVQVSTVAGAMAKAMMGAEAALPGPAAAALATALQTGSVLLVDSGTTALRLALEGLCRDRPHRPVALPAYSCFDIATAADGAGCRVVLYDLDACTLGPDPVSFDRALAQEPAVVVVAHLYGFPADLRMAEARSREAGVHLVEDAAQAAGGALDRRPLGSWGAVSVLSFGRGKGIAAGGGGAIVAHDAAGEDLLRWAGGRLGVGRLGAGAATALLGQWLLGRPWLYGLPAALPFLHLGETLYRSPAPPRAMNRLARHILPAALEWGRAELVRRRVIGQRLLDRARASRSVEAIAPIAGAAPGFLRLPVLLRDLVPAESSRSARLGIMPAYPRPLVELSPFKARVANLTDQFPGARRLARQLVTLPTHSLLAESDLTAIEQWMASGARGEPWRP